MSHSDCILLYNLIHYRRLFNIIEFLYILIIELQLKSLTKRFERLIQKLLNCKIEKLNKLLNFLSTIASSFLSYLLDFDLFKK